MLTDFFFGGLDFCFLIRSVKCCVFLLVKACTILSPPRLWIVNFPVEFNKASKDVKPKFLNGIRSPFNLK